MDLTNIRDDSHDKLLKQATLPGRNMTGLAILWTVVTAVLLLGLLAASSKAGDANLALLGGMAIGGVLATVGMWALAGAVREGNEKGLIAPLILLVGNFLTLFVALVKGSNARAAGAAGAESLGLFPLFINLAVTYLLARDYGLIRKLRQLSLWPKAYPSARPTSRKVVFGSVLVGLGVAASLGGGVASGLMTAAATQEEQQLAQSFVQLCTTRQQAFLGDLRAYCEGPTQETRSRVEKSAGDLCHDAQLVVDKSGEFAKLHAAAKTFHQATEAWQEGIKLLAEDPERAQELLNKGDSLRQQAGQIFDTAYAKP